ncbi:MAG: 16S rRNA (uracil(1498)-N(3))-methyltransferase [Acidobacteriota bacterium]|nr:16S rRNA (uracil(1498)-N(3))-methyltransferase [Acidobacteriota bacterium]
MDEPVSRARFVVASLPAPGDSVRLPAEEAAHARSRRVARGEHVVLIDGSGREAEAEILSVRGGQTEVRVLEIRPPAASAPAEIWLGVAGIRAERLSWVAEKAGELGVACLSLIRTERTQTFRAGGGALARVERIVRESAKQSGSARWPRCEGPLGLEEALASPSVVTRLMLDPAGASFPREFPGRSVALLVGPEGGWTDSERDLARDAGWILSRLPAGALRADTAAVAAVVLARAAFGALRC